MYEHLLEMLIHAKSCGMTTAITTNGTLLQPDVLQELEPHLDLMAISVDGPPDVHNTMRQSSKAFDNLLLGIEMVKATSIRFGLISTVTTVSWEHLLWLAEFASAQGAGLLQLHPLEDTGRARGALGTLAPDSEVLAKVYLLVLALAKKYGDTLAFQFDVFHRDYIRKNPDLVYATELDSIPADMPPASLLSLLVLQADGSVVPMSYGFSKKYEICNIYRQRLIESWNEYCQSGYRDFRQLCKHVFSEATIPAELPFFNWYELIVNRSHSL